MIFYLILMFKDIVLKTRCLINWIPFAEYLYVFVSYFRCWGKSKFWIIVLHLRETTGGRLHFLHNFAVIGCYFTHLNQFKRALNLWHSLSFYDHLGLVLCVSWVVCNISAKKGISWLVFSILIKLNLNLFTERWLLSESVAIVQQITPCCWR